MPNFSTAVTHGLLKARFVVLFLWAALGISMAFFIMKFIGATSQQFVPPDGTQAHAANLAIAAHFPGRQNQALYSVFVQYTPPANASGVGAPATVYDVPTVSAFFSELEAQLRPRAPPKTLVGNYFQLEAEGITVLAQRLVSPSGRSMILSFDAPVPFVDDEALDFGTAVQDTAHGLTGPVLGNQSLLGPVGLAGANLHTGVTGLPIFVKTVVKTVKSDMALADAIVMPIAIIVMGLAISSVRLLILPVATIGLSLSVSFGLMYFVASNIRVSSTAPSLMMSLCTAMSIDYNLFLVSRYIEELRAGVRGPQVVATVLSTAGHTIVVSGLTLMLACLGLVVFPMNMLRSFGIGCSLSIGAAMLASLTFGPALLLTFPGFFENAARPWSHYLPFLRKRRGGGSPGSMAASTTNPAGQSTSADFAGAGDSGNEKRRHGHGGIGLNPKSAYDSTDCSASESTIGEPSVIVPVAGYAGHAGRKQDNSSSNRRPSVEASTATGISTSGNIGGGAGAAPATKAASPGRSSSGDYVFVTRDPRSSMNGGAGRAPEVSAVFALLGRMLRFPVNLLIAVVILAGVCCFVLPLRHMRISDSFDQYLARGSQFRADWHTFVGDFGYGFTEPYTIIAVIDDGAQPNATFANSLLAWTTCQSVLLSIAADTKLPGANLTQFTAPMVYGGELQSLAKATACLEASAECDPNMLALWVRQVSASDHKAVLITFTSSFSPTGNDGEDLYRRLLSHLNGGAVAAATPDGGPRLVFNIDGVGPRAMDAIERIYSQFPIIIGGTFAVVFLVVCAAFRTPVIPLRSVVSIAATELFVFGMATLVYQQPGVLDWLGIPAVESVDAITWIVPIVAFTVIVGVALDYDVFLITRVNECYFEDGHTPRRAVQLGLWSTGRIITAAGVIMAIAFFGLMLSSTPALNVLGFYLVTAVLFDTFVVRTLLVPTTMSVLGRANWWPRHRAGGPSALGTSENVALTGSLSAANLEGAGDNNAVARTAHGADGGVSPQVGVTPASSPPRISGRVGVARPMPLAARRSGGAAAGGALSEYSDEDRSVLTDQLVPNTLSPRGSAQPQSPHYQPSGTTRGSLYGAV